MLGARIDERLRKRRRAQRFGVEAAHCANVGCFETAAAASTRACVINIVGSAIRWRVENLRELVWADAIVRELKTIYQWCRAAFFFARPWPGIGARHERAASERRYGQRERHRLRPSAHATISWVETREAYTSKG